jgi:hypothetical protein
MKASMQEKPCVLTLFCHLPYPIKRKKERKKENGSAAAASVYISLTALLHLFEAKLVFVVRRGEGCVGII